MHHWISVVCGPKFTKFFRSTWKWLWLKEFFFRFSICRSVPELFAIKVENCQKSCRNLDDFWPSQYLGGGSSKSCTHIITLASHHVVWKKFCEDTPTGPEVIGAHTLNFRSNFKFSPLKFFSGDPRPRCGVRYVAWVNL